MNIFFKYSTLSAGLYIKQELIPELYKNPCHAPRCRERLLWAFQWLFQIWGDYV